VFYTVNGFPDALPTQMNPDGTYATGTIPPPILPPSTAGQLTNTFTSYETMTPPENSGGKLFFLEGP
jgi:hypothetical protein